MQQDHRSTCNTERAAMTTSTYKYESMVFIIPKHNVTPSYSLLDKSSSHFRQSSTTRSFDTHSTPYSSSIKLIISSISHADQINHSSCIIPLASSSSTMLYVCFHVRLSPQRHPQIASSSNETATQRRPRTSGSVSAWTVPSRWHSPARSIPAN